LRGGRGSSSSGLKKRRPLGRLRVSGFRLKAAGQRQLGIVVERHAAAAAAEQIGHRARTESAVENLNLMRGDEGGVRDPARAAERQ
jgi:hypothetical protein